MAFQLTLADRLEEALDFFHLPAALQFHAAIRQVAHPADDLVAPGELLAGVTETDPLHPAFIEYLAGHHSASSMERRWAAAASGQTLFSQQPVASSMPFRK